MGWHRPVAELLGVLQSLSVASQCRPVHRLHVSWLGVCVSGPAAESRGEGPSLGCLLRTPAPGRPRGALAPLTRRPCLAAPPGSGFGTVPPSPTGTAATP